MVPESRCELRAMKSSKRVDGGCPNDAIELLRIRRPGSLWEEYPRCHDHPAQADVRMALRLFPDTQYEIVELGR